MSDMILTSIFETDPNPKGWVSRMPYEVAIVCHRVGRQWEALYGIKRADPAVASTSFELPACFQLAYDLCEALDSALSPS